MKKQLLLILFISSSLFSQNTVGTISVTPDVYDGYTLFSSHTNTFLLNNCGQVVNQWVSAYPPGHSVYLLPDGNLIRAGRKDGFSSINFGGVGGIIEMFDWEGNVVWQYEFNTDDGRLHHDIFPMPNGNILMTAATRIFTADALQAGRDPNLLTQEDLYNERIFEVEPLPNNGFNIVWEWNVTDHMIQDFDDTKDNFGVVTDNFRKLDINFTNGSFTGSNWLHMNSVQYNEALDQIVISSRNLSEIWIIDHSTTTAEAATSNGGTYGHGGDFLYRWGNPQSYDKGTEIDRILYGQHTPYMIPPGLNDAGKIMVFNNGSGRTPVFSEVLLIDPPTTAPGEYTYDNTNPFGPESPEIYYEEPDEFFSGILSSAFRLPNGNTLICEGAEGRFFELDESNTLVWEYFIPMNNVTGAITAQGDPRPATGNTTFRALKYGADYAAFAGRDLTPGDPIETNFNLDACATLSTESNETLQTSIYPNPVASTLTVQSSEQIDKIELYDVLGKKVASITGATAINMATFNSGIYILKVHSNNKVTSQKVIKN
jgi:hypothetical protein